jgi:hypothetical protein
VYSPSVIYRTRIYFKASEICHGPGEHESQIVASGNEIPTTLTEGKSQTEENWNARISNWWINISSEG